MEDFQQRAVAAGSEDSASVATLQKCEELLPGEVSGRVIIIIVIIVIFNNIMVNGLVIIITTTSSFQVGFQALSISFPISGQNYHQFTFAGEDKEQFDHLETHTQGENMEKGDNMHTISIYHIA